LLALDVAVFRAIQEIFRSPGWMVLLSALTVLGSGWGSLLVVPLFASPRSRRLAVTLAGVLLGTAPITFLLKVLVRRRRPFLVLDGVRALVFEAPTDFSFPSGHASGSFAFATFVALVILRRPLLGPALTRRRWLRRLFATLLFLGAVGVGLSRVALGVHFPGDVLVGALIGASTGALGAHVYLRGSAARARPTGSA